MASSCATKPVPLLTAVPTPQVDQRVLQDCLGPTKVPDRILSKQELVVLYNENADRLQECKAKHRAVKEQLLIIEQFISEVRKSL